MINTLYLPELRELLAEHNKTELSEFCTALHPARTAEFMEGLNADESWAVLIHADLPLRTEIFKYFDDDKQIAILESQPRDEIGELIGELPPDDRVDLLKDANPEAVAELMLLVPSEERRDILRLQAYIEGTAGSVMTTEVAKLSESLTVRGAIESLGMQAEALETIYYLYVVDDNDDDHLRGVVTTRQLVSALNKPETTLSDIMERDLITAYVLEDQEDVARKVARYDLLAIPVVDDEHRMVGIITHDDVIDVVVEEATEDAHRIAAVEPLEESYLDTRFFTLVWKRAIWLVVLFIAAILTAWALTNYEGNLDAIPWLVLFIPLVISSGGNSGSQSATLIIRALTVGDIRLADWSKVVGRELLMGLWLGGLLGLLGLVIAPFLTPDIRSLKTAMVVPITLLLVVICGTLTGSVLPLIFKRIGLDPAMMSNPFVAGIIDIVGIVIYMKVAAILIL